MPSLNFAVDLHVPSRLVDGRISQSVHQPIIIVKLLRNVDCLDYNVARLPEF